MGVQPRRIPTERVELRAVSLERNHVRDPSSAGIVASSRTHESRGGRPIWTAFRCSPMHQLPVPKPGPHEVLIRLDTAVVSAVGTRPFAMDPGRSPGGAHFPLVPGVDGAGTVVARGARVRRLRPGDRGYGYEFGNRQGGFYAEYAVANADHVARVPGKLDLKEAAVGRHDGSDGAARHRSPSIAAARERC